MSLPSFSIRRPITVFMFFLAVVLFGVISAALLRQELFPPIVYPKLTVVTNYANAAPEEIETLITKPIEEAVGSTPGLRGVTSISREGLSLVIAEFGWDQDMDFAALGVREKIDLIKARLPRDSEEPTVVKYNPFELPVMTLSVSSTLRSPVHLKRFASRWIKDELEKINGVASATISGGQDEEILVEVDQARLKASTLSIQDISNSIAQANLNYPGGTIKENFYEYLVRTIGEFEKEDEIGKISVGKEDKEEEDSRSSRNEDEVPSNKLVFLTDVADVKRQTKDRTSFSRFNGKENLTVAIQKQAQSNTIGVAKEIRQRLEELSKQMPKDIQIDVVYNQADFIEEAINGVRDAAIQGGVLAFLVILIFMKNVRTSMLIVVVIPITILATFTLMHFMGISLNVISLGGVALGVGMLIDSAIVVIENVFRHASKSKKITIYQHASRGTEEVIAPLIASTLTTVMVFLPMIFVTGIAGQIFKELAIVVVATQVFSIIVAFTLLPMLITQFHKNQSVEQDTSKPTYKILNTIELPIQAIRSVYTKLLPSFLRHKGTYLVVVLFMFLIAVFFLTKYDRIVMPKVDQGQFMIKVDLPVGTRVERTNAIVSRFEKYLRTLPNIKSISSVVGSSKSTSSRDVVQSIGSNQSQIIVTLNKERDLSTDEMIQVIRRDMERKTLRKALKEARLSFILYESSFKVGGEDSAPVVIHIKGNNLNTLRALTHKVEEGLKKVSGIYDVSNTIPESAPETKIVVDKDKASFYRISVTDLATAAHVSIKGAIASKFKEEGKEIDIRVVLQKADRSAISELPFIQMHSPLGLNVPLNEIVHFKRGRGPSEIKRISQERTFQVSAKIFNRSLKDITADTQSVIDNLNIPSGYIIDIAGESLEVQESFKSLQLALTLSIILVYMIMAAQFESYFQPFIIMFTVPLSIIGVSTALGVTGTEISVVVILGVILLGGIVVNNGIILIDFINLSRRKGESVQKAVINSGLTRFRPILMTAMTTILGLLPLALGLGEGSKLQSPMAITVMGGLLAATFLTLLVIPAIYALSYRIQEIFVGKK